MLRFKITTKLVMVLLATGIVLATAMAAATYWRFLQGFQSYLSEVELGTLNGTVEKLVASYREQGSWDFLRHNHQLWISYLPPERLSGTGDRQPRNRPPMYRFPPPPPLDGEIDVDPLRGMPPPQPAEPPLPPSDRTGITTRLQLLDEKKQPVIGPPPAKNDEVYLRPIVMDSKTIGWLSLSPLKLPKSGLERSFRRQQLTALYPIAAGSLLLALLFGIPLGRHLLKPIKNITRGANALARGRFSTRLDVSSSDELGQLTRDFNHLAEVLERNELLRRRSMADISHELRTPLSILRGGIEAMQDGIHPMDLNHLNRLHDNLMSLSQLIDDLYDLALTDVGALNYRMESFDLAEVLLSVAETNELKFSERGLRFHHGISPSLDMAGDARRIRQVVNNLLKNSRRYTDRGGEVILRGYKRLGSIVIEVEDSSPGVAPEKIERLFDRFYRVESSRSRTGGGAGLGLAICRSIVEAHQGTIEAKASRLGGLKIVIKLPAE